MSTDRFPHETGDAVQELLDDLPDNELRQMVILGVTTVLIGRTSNRQASLENFVLNLRRLVDRLDGIEMHTLQ